MDRQLSFDLPVTVSLGAEDFYVAPPNARAYAMVTDDAIWPDGKLALIGPPGGGKSHLGKVWQGLSDAILWHAHDLSPSINLPGRGARIIIEDMEHLPQGSEELMFHLHNHLRSTNGRLLMTSILPPSRWPITLPDLASRMQATSVARIEDPDDDLLMVVMLKQFADRQVVPAPDVLTYLMPRVERSFAAISQIVTALDVTALSRKAPITRALARDVLSGLESTAD